MTLVPSIQIQIAPGARLIGDAQPAASALKRMSGVSEAMPQKTMLRAAAAATVGPTATPAATPVQHGVPRDALAVAYVTTTGPQPDVPFDALLFEAPRDRNQTFYICRYRLATQAGDYLAKLRRDGTDWVLDIPFERYPADGPAARVPPPTPVDAIARVSLVYSVEFDEGTLQKSLEFQSVSLRPDGVVASLRLSATPDQDELYDALRSRASQARLTVWRQAKIAVPTQLATDELARLTNEMRALTVAPLVWMRANDMGGYLIAEGNQRSENERFAFILENLSGHDQLQSGDTVRLRIPGTPSCLAGVSGGPMKRVPVQNPPPPEQQMLIRKRIGSTGDDKPRFADGGPLKIGDTLGISFFRLRGDSYYAQSQWQWALESPPPDDPGWAAKQAEVAQKKVQIDRLQRQFSTTSFDVVDASLPFQVAPVPFIVAERTHPNFYKDVKPSGTGGGGLSRIQVGDRVYYQDLAQRQRFYYLPDRFELRTPSGQPFPDVRIRATPDVNTYLVEYVAAPVVDDTRLRADAANQLLQEANRLAPVPVATIELLPLLGDQTSLSLKVPIKGGGWTSQARPNTVADLFHPFTDVLTVDAAGLRQLVDALFQTDSTPFLGTIAVSLGVPDVWARHEVKFEGRVRGARDAFFNAAFDPTVPARFMRRIDVVGEAFPFDGAQSVAVMFEFGGVIILTPSQRRGFTDVGQPIAEYVLNAADAGSYRYRLAKGQSDVITDWRTARGSTLRLTAW